MAGFAVCVGFADFVACAYPNVRVLSSFSSPLIADWLAHEDSTVRKQSDCPTFVLVRFDTKLIVFAPSANVIR